MSDRMWIEIGRSNEFAYHEEWEPTLAQDPEDAQLNAYITVTDMGLAVRVSGPDGRLVDLDWEALEKMVALHGYKLSRV